jgi:hypothetical protein
MSASIRQSNLFAAEDYKKVFKAFQFINYSAYDFDTLKQALINYIQTYYPEDFNDYIESSEFIAIVELLAYFGTSLAFRTELNSRENFIDTAERRESIIRLAQMVNYVPRRNISASGLMKITAVQTNQPLVDPSGISINDSTIFWNDPNNADWFDQFVQVCNASFSTINPFGRPTKSGSVGTIPTDLYQMNSVLGLNVTYPASVSVGGQTYPIDICNPDFVTNETIFERDPDPLNAFNLVYRNDSLGVGSNNTGFFLYFKQGNLINVDTDFQFPVPNRVFPIEIRDINQSDVFVQETDENGTVISKWAKVPALAGENIIYNSIQFSQRNIFSVISGPNDTVSVRFADGNFGNVPTGLFRFWVRTSANQALVIRPDSAQSLQINIPYIGADLQEYVLRVTFGLEQTIGNAAPSETNEQIKLRAPEVFSTQSRMVNGSDYNVLPLIYGNQIAKIQAIGRTYSGQSRYIDLNDPTGFHKDLLIFGDDGALYRDNQNVLEQVIRDSSNETSINVILTNRIQEMLRHSSVSSFFYDEYLTQFEKTIRVNKGFPGQPADGYSILELNNPNQVSLYWKTSPGKFKNDTGFFAASPTALAAETLVNTFTTANVQFPVIGAYRPWRLIDDGAVVEFANTSVSNAVVINSGSGYTAAPVINISGGGGTGAEATAVLTGGRVTSINFNNSGTGYTTAPVINISGGGGTGAEAICSILLDATRNTSSVTSVIQNGIPVTVDTLNLFAGAGPVELGTEEQNNYQAIKVYPRFRSNLSPGELIDIINRITAGISFWIYYDLLMDKWQTSDAATFGLLDQSEQPWRYAIPSISALGVEQIYSNWGPYPDSGLLYVSISTNSQVGTTTYDLTARGRVYVFESYKDVRFYWQPNDIIIDNATGLALRDNIEIIPLVNTNNTIDNNLPPSPITSPQAAFLKEQISFNITGVYVQADGYQDQSKVEVSLVDENQDGIPDNPDGFNHIVSLDDRVVFEFYRNEITGYQSTRPWTSRWATDLQDVTTPLYLHFPVQQPGISTVLYGSPFLWSTPLDQSQQLTPPSGVVYLDEADLIFINNLSQLSFVGGTSPLAPTIANQVTAFVNGTNSFTWINGTELVTGKADILVNSILNKVFLLNSTPGYGVYYKLHSQVTGNTTQYPEGEVIIDELDKYHFDKNGKSFTQNESVKELQRLPMYFKWSHYSPIDQRIDPAATNIIDMVVVTDSFYRDILVWKNNNSTVFSLPVKPTTEELRIQFQELNQYKMVSDNMIWNSGTFKILFGTQAERELQATFKVVKAPASRVSDNEVKTKVVQAIDTYFDIRNWDFGEKFFYTELAAFIHQQLSRIISSVVIVPNSANSQFGNLFEIISGPTELFLSTATVNNVQIISSLTEQNLRV